VAKKKKAADEAAGHAGSLAQDDTAAAGADTAATAAGDSGTRFGVDETPRSVFLENMQHHNLGPWMSYGPKQALCPPVEGERFLPPVHGDTSCVCKACSCSSVPVSHLTVGLRVEQYARIWRMAAHSSFLLELQHASLLSVTPD